MAKASEGDSHVVQALFVEHKIVFVRGIKYLATGRCVEELVCSPERATFSTTVD